MSKISKKVLIVAIGWLFGAHLFGFVLEVITEDSDPDVDEQNQNN